MNDQSDPLVPPHRDPDPQADSRQHFSISEPQSDFNSNASNILTQEDHENPAHFDCTNLSMFFSCEQMDPKGCPDSKSEGKRKPAENGMLKESSAKPNNSKDYSNLDELCQDTTILSNVTDSKGPNKRVQDDTSISKVHSEDSSDISNCYSQDNSVLKQQGKTRNNEKSLLKQMREERIEQEIAHNISKLSLNNSQDEPENCILKDLKSGPKNNLDPKVIERIKSKVNYKGASGAGGSDSTKSSQSESNNNRSIFNTGKTIVKPAMSPIIPQIRRKINIQPKPITEEEDSKTTNDYIAKIDKLILENEQKTANDSDDLIFEAFSDINGETPNPTPRRQDGSTASKRLSLESDFMFGKPEQSGGLDKKSLSEEALRARTIAEAHAMCVGPQSLNARSNQDLLQGKGKPNLSIISTDSTIESDNFTSTTNDGGHGRDASFLTYYSSNSFNNSGKLDFNSPNRLDSEREISELGSQKKNAGGQQGIMSAQRWSSLQQQQHQQQKQHQLNHSSVGYFGSYGSGENSERSISIEEQTAVTAQSSSYSTPQARHLGNNNKMMEQQFFMIPPAGQSFGKSTNNSSGNNSERKQQQSARSNQSNNDKNGAGRMKKKNQDDNDPSNFEVKIDRVKESGRTTLMVKNIPNKYDLTLTLQTIDKNHKGKYDFFYLPIDFKNKCNVGYAFINFIKPEYIIEFFKEFNGTKWEKFNSEKICEIRYARLQGLETLVEHFQYSSVMNQQDKKLKPYITPGYEIQDKGKIEELIERQKRQTTYKNVGNNNNNNNNNNHHSINNNHGFNSNNHNNNNRHHHHHHHNSMNSNNNNQNYGNYNNSNNNNRNHNNGGSNYHHHHHHHSHHHHNNQHYQPNFNNPQTNQYYY